MCMHVYTCMCLYMHTHSCICVHAHTKRMELGIMYVLYLLTVCLYSQTTDLTTVESFSVPHSKCFCHKGMQWLVWGDLQGNQVRQCGVDAVDGLTDVWQALPKLKGYLTLHAQSYWDLLRIITVRRMGFTKFLTYHIFC